jgi:hypothetical protein
MENEWTKEIERLRAQVKQGQKIIIILDGGLVQEIISERPLEALILNSDTEGADDDEIVRAWETDFCHVTREASNDPELVKEPFHALQEQADAELADYFKADEKRETILEDPRPRHPGDFQFHPTNEQMEYFKRGGR